MTSPAATYVYPSVGSDGTLYVAFVGGFDTTNKNRVGHVYVTRSNDDGVTFGPFVEAATPRENPDGFLPNTNFRDGIIENFAASPTYPGHLYLTYEDWDPDAGQFDVRFRQSTNGGLNWGPVQTVNDASNSGATDQFQPSVAAGPDGAVAVAFYDRRANCPDDASILPAHRGAANTCIDVSLQPYKDGGGDAGAVAVGGNVRVSQFSWDPDQPQQKVGGSRRRRSTALAGDTARLPDGAAAATAYRKGHSQLERRKPAAGGDAPRVDTSRDVGTRPSKLDGSAGGWIARVFRRRRPVGRVRGLAEPFEHLEGLRSMRHIRPVRLGLRPACR